MIERVLVVGQGPNDLGFLKGLAQLLKCEAEPHERLSDGSEARQRGQLTRGKQDAKFIWDRRGNVDLVVRLTDGDTDRPQDTSREELKRWPPDASSLLVCGVCDRDVEHWMCLDLDYAAEKLSFDKRKLPTKRDDRSGFIKSRIRKLGGPDYQDFVTRFVANAPPATIRRWLHNPAFSHFHDQCRAAARRQNCPAQNLRDSEGAAR